MIMKTYNFTSTSSSSLIGSILNVLLIVSSLSVSNVAAFTTTPTATKASRTYLHKSSILYSSPSSSTSSSNTSSLPSKITQLKKILSKEYTTFFNPMYTSYYSPTVTFTDPMTTLSGVQSYQNNVDMLASRTLLGKLLFTDASISLHSVTGGDVIQNDKDVVIEDIITRWTLRMTLSILPWKPTARFTGISVYKVIPTTTNNTPTTSNDNNNGVSIINQIDYWDSINIKPFSNGQYQTVDKSIAINDFLNQLKPNGFTAQSAAPELPYQLLRRGDGYEVRYYPSYKGVKLPYKRRDEGFGSLGAFTKGMNPLSPALMDVQKDDVSDKYMMWPLVYAKPGERDEDVVVPNDALEKAGKGQWRTIRIVDVPSKVVAVREFSGELSKLEIIIIGFIFLN